MQNFMSKYSKLTSNLKKKNIIYFQKRPKNELNTDRQFYTTQNLPTILVTTFWHFQNLPWPLQREEALSNIYNLKEQCIPAIDAFFCTLKRY